MEAKIYIFEKIGDPWYKIVCRNPIITDYESLEALENRISVFVCGNEKITEVNAFDIYGSKLLVSIVKSQKKYNEQFFYGMLQP